MATGALFIGWGPVISGREQKALQVFNEAIQYYTQVQQRGQIDSFEAVALEPHGGNLSGFLLVRGDAQQLAMLRTTDEFIRQITRAGLVVTNLRITGGFIGEGLTKLFADFQTQAADLAR